MENKHTSGELEQMMALPLSAKIAMSKRRIKEWYEAFDGMVYISFSGGKDSTVLLHLVRSMYPDVEAVYCDTGLEYPEIKQFITKFENVTVIRPEKNFKKICLEDGYPFPTKEYARKIHYAQMGSPWAIEYMHQNCTEPGSDRPSRYNIPQRYYKLYKSDYKVGDKCCEIMKKRPFHKFERTSKKKPFLGNLASESKVRKQVWMKFGCNAFDNKKQKSTPLAFWTNNDILQYIVENNLEIASVYGDIVETGKYIEYLGHIVPQYTTTGLERTGCVFCMFGITREKHPNRFEIMKETHPKLYEYCMKPVGEGGAWS